jgi:hypothetical protein
MLHLKYRHSKKNCKCNNDHVHKSRGEADFCDDLFKNVEAGHIKDVEYEKRFYLHDIDGRTIAHHYPDFLITHFDDSKEVIEYKGVTNREWVLKKVIFQYEYPEIIYTVHWHKGGKYK